MTIWKYQLAVDDIQFIEMPKGAQLLSVQVQYGIPCLWARVDPDAELEFVEIVTYVTGGMARNNLQYIGTYQLHSGSFIGHVFSPII